MNDKIYCPCKSNLEFAKVMANKIKEYSNIKGEAK